MDTHEQMVSVLAAGPRLTCGDLRADDAGRTVTLRGWVNRRRDHGGLIFIDLRDRYGLTQVVFNPESSPAAHAVASEVRGEYVLAVTGTVRPRPEGTANPNLATVGLSEEKARERYGEVDIYKASFRALKLTLGEKTDKTFMKLVVDRASQRVVGAHMIGADAGEVIQGVAIAVKMGATKAQFDATIGIHPTGAEEFVTMREKAT